MNRTRSCYEYGLLRAGAGPASKVSGDDFSNIW